MLELIWTYQYVHVDNKNKDILILGVGPKNELDDTTLTAEAKYPNYFPQANKRFIFILSLHYTGRNSFLYGNVTTMDQFKAKNSEIKDYALFLSNILNDFTINTMKKTDEGDL